MLNTVPTVAAGRQPRAVVRVNGAPMPGWVSWEVTANTYYEADTFRVSFATSAMADQTAPAWGALDKSLGRKLKAADWFSQQAEIYVEILAGFPSNPADPSANELSSLIYGRVDDIEFDPVSTMLSLTGRDLTAVFIDTRGWRVVKPDQQRHRHHAGQEPCPDPEDHRHQHTGRRLLPA